MDRPSRIISRAKPTAGCSSMEYVEGPNAPGAGVVIGKPDRRHSLKTHIEGEIRGGRGSKVKGYLKMRCGPTPGVPGYRSLPSSDRVTSGESCLM